MEPSRRRVRSERRHIRGRARWREQAAPPPQGFVGSRRYPRSKRPWASPGRSGMCSGPAHRPGILVASRTPWGGAWPRTQRRSRAIPPQQLLMIAISASIAYVRQDLRSPHRRFAMILVKPPSPSPRSANMRCGYGRGGADLVACEGGTRRSVGNRDGDHRRPLEGEFRGSPMAGSGSRTRIRHRGRGRIEFPRCRRRGPPASRCRR